MLGMHQVKAVDLFVLERRKFDLLVLLQKNDLKEVHHNPVQKEPLELRLDQ
jgi:hypothetical protein